MSNNSIFPISIAAARPVSLSARSNLQKGFAPQCGIEFLEVRRLMSTAATFAGADAVTQGAWQGAYGSDGYAVPNDAAPLPASPQLAVADASLYTWAASTAAPRALQLSSAPASRRASCWYSGSGFSLDLNLADG